MPHPNPEETPIPSGVPAPPPRSEALEAELAMLEALLPPETKPEAPTRVEPTVLEGGAS